VVGLYPEAFRRVTEFCSDSAIALRALQTLTLDDRVHGNGVTVVHQGQWLPPDHILAKLHPHLTERVHP
jgi:hypothetical protein